ncbi:MAG: STAS domain-containing protein [Anaerolineales bacterium]|jgi:anti-anti-sigma factor|nr:STAS domain-containing protein [Anaerolineales bacterium]
MQISFSQHGSVMVMHLLGDIDSSTYTTVIDKAQQAYDDGARSLLLDLEKVPYVSSAGLMALHTVVRIFTGQSVNLKDGSRPSFRAINPKQDAPARDHVKLLNPQAAVAQVLDVVGLTQFLEVFPNLESALNSFPAP